MAGDGGSQMAFRRRSSAANNATADQARSALIAAFEVETPDAYASLGCTVSVEDTSWRTRQKIAFCAATSAAAAPNLQQGPVMRKGRLAVLIYGAVSCEGSMKQCTDGGGQLSQSAAVTVLRQLHTEGA